MVKRTWKQMINNVMGTPFQKKVWHAMCKIPKGEVRTYAQIAKQIGRPKSFRAVANACGKNPFAPDVPCHRVVGSNGIGGYSGKGGVKRKRELLLSEGVTFDV